MGSVTVDDHGVRHVLSTLGPRPAGQVRQAVVALVAVDEVTGLPVGPVRVSTSVAGLSGQSTAEGVAGLVGVPARVFPGLAAQSYPLDVAVEADGFLPWTTNRTVAVQAGFPATFARIDLGPVALHRRPVTVEVTTLSLDPQGRVHALAGADVRVTRVWRRIDALDAAGDAATMINLPLGISQRWPAGTGLDSVSLVPDTEPVRRLTRGAAPGDTRLGVDRLGSLAVGDLVGLDLADGERREYRTVAVVLGSLDVTSPADLDLTGPVRSTHLDATTARRVPAPLAAPTEATLTEPADAEDVTVFVDTTAPFGTVEVLRAHGAAITDEYVDAHAYRATSDADGCARLPGLSRVAAVEITATSGALTAVARLTPDSRSPADSLALILR